VRIFSAVAAWLTFALMLGVESAAVAQTTSADPFAARFRTVWSSDTCVQAHGQSWADYRGWLDRFYSGSDGWTAASNAMTARITDASVRAADAKALESLGARVAGEWAKDNACRKIRTTTGFFNADEDGKPALSTWRDALQAAAAQDSGDGASIGAAVNRIRRQVDLLLRPRT
jgi:hypothetical protein